MHMVDDMYSSSKFWNHWQQTKVSEKTFCYYNVVVAITLHRHLPCDCDSLEMKHNWQFSVPQKMKFQPRMNFLGGLDSFLKYTWSQNSFNTNSNKNFLVRVAIEKKLKTWWNCSNQTWHQIWFNCPKLKGSRTDVATPIFTQSSTFVRLLIFSKKC
jgi:hypothetical protein